MFTTLDNIDEAIAKLKPGEDVEILVGIPRDLTSEELTVIQSTLIQNGVFLAEPVAVGSTPDWPHALRIHVKVPEAKIAVFPVVIPVAAAIILALGAVGVTTFLGVKVGNVVDQVSKYFMPTLLVVAGFFLLYAVVAKPRS